MKKILKKLERRISEIPAQIKKQKLLISETKAISRKKQFYGAVCWSRQQADEMRSYWKENYGYAISDRWHKLYESMNGVYCKAYFPEMLYTTELEPAINPNIYCRIINDKSIIELLFSKVDEIHIPKTILTCCNGAYRTSEYRILNKNNVESYLSNVGKCIIKPTVETGSGKGVQILNIASGIDTYTNIPIKNIFNALGKNYIIQECVNNSKELSKLYPYSLNTIRLITYLVEDEVHHVPLVLRIGVNGNRVDNIHAGGLCIGVNEDGTLKTEAYQLGYGDKAVKYRKHPDTEIQFSNYWIGDTKKVIDAAIRLHSMIPHVGIVSWDLTINDNDEIVLIEANCRNQSVWFPQIVNKCAIFGEDTPYMLRKIYKKRRI